MARLAFLDPLPLVLRCLRRIVAGRSVMSAQIELHDGPNPNALITWSCSQHDNVVNVSGFGDCLESRSIDALGNVTKSRSDGAGRTLESLDADGNISTAEFDASSNTLKSRDPNNIGFDAIYDELGRVTSRTDTYGDSSGSTYDKSGNALTQTGTKFYYHHNQQFSTVALTNASGQVIERYAYTAYGEQTILDNTGATQTWATNQNRYTYTGREWDNAISLYHFRARYYDAQQGRFISRDPLGFVDGTSLYRAYFGQFGLDPFGSNTLDVGVHKDGRTIYWDEGGCNCWVWYHDRFNEDYKGSKNIQEVVPCPFKLIIEETPPTGYQRYPTMTGTPDWTQAPDETEEAETEFDLWWILGGSKPVKPSGKFGCTQICERAGLGSPAPVMAACLRNCQVQKKRGVRRC